MRQDRIDYFLLPEQLIFFFLQNMYCKRLWDFPTVRFQYANHQYFQLIFVQLQIIRIAMWPTKTRVARSMTYFRCRYLPLTGVSSLLNAHTQASRALSLGFVLPTSNAIMRRIFRVTSCGQKYVNIQPKLEFTNYFFKIIPHRLIYLVLCQETLYLCIEHYSSLTIGRILWTENEK